MLGSRDVRGGEIRLREFVIPSRVTRVLVDTRIPWTLMQSTLSRLAREKGHPVRAMGAFKCGGAHFERDCNARNGTGKQSFGKGKQSNLWSKSEGKFKSKENKGKSKGKSKGTKHANQGAEGVHKGKTSKAGLLGIENSKSEACSETQDSARTCGHFLGTVVGTVTNGTME